ncbi:MAG TPA: aminoacyl-tRNA hydrolase [Armatimonadota bacterium]|jgi:PTH1 family peptidyl-tRNA hydrolase|nr:aminoacyl-tRNA hydrolase [Armatimonadota bacterium]HOQ28702.1 aminoacyl-tRNA hydrolase [Armatimonadota bacterium]HPO73135.1 aminoacyl-tRNA hydrolase [Armatimonadota bacterium]HPT98760.1 aminoacyl-tRNA hydrolase [Armatimonadota bacterium]
MMKIILGLGNPGAEYASTRHNVGFMTADLLAKRHGIRLTTRRHSSLLGEGTIAGVAVVLAKPQTYMNCSGDAALSLLSRYRVSPQDLIVICDDMNLDVARVRVRASGSAGGHNGLKSIIARIGTDAFPRVRIGVGRVAPDQWIDHVLGEFTAEERPQIEEAVARAADAVEVLLREGPEAAANQFNRRQPPPETPEPGPEQPREVGA